MSDNEILSDEELVAIKLIYADSETWDLPFNKIIEDIQKVIARLVWSAVSGV